MTTTSTELQTKDLDFSVNYVPTEIKINNYDEMKRRVEAYVETYKKPVVTSQTVSGDKLVRAQMNNLVKAMDDKRKSIKREYNEPLTAFENQINELKESIQAVIDPINAGIKSVEAQEREKRREKIIGWINDIAAKYELTADDLPEFDESWTNRTTTKKKIFEDVDSQFLVVRKRIDQIAEYKELIKAYAEARHLEPEGWVGYIENGRTAPEVIKMIDLAVEQKKAREEATAAINKMKKEQAQQATVEVNNKRVDPETGEIIASDKAAERTAQQGAVRPVQPDKVHPATYNVLLKLNNITGPQTRMLKDFLDDNGVDYEVKEA